MISTITLPVYLPTCPFACLPACLPACLLACLFICLSVYLPTYLQLMVDKSLASGVAGSFPWASAYDIIYQIDVYVLYSNKVLLVCK